MILWVYLASIVWLFMVGTKPKLERSQDWNEAEISSLIHYYPSLILDLVQVAVTFIPTYPIIQPREHYVEANFMGTGVGLDFELCRERRVARAAGAE